MAIVSVNGTVLLVGGGSCNKSMIEPLLMQCKSIVAADSGADHLRTWGVMPDALIGDLDSVSAATIASLPAGRVHHIAEQDSTDFDKALRNIEASVVVGVGFLGKRVDHELAALNVLVRRPDKICVLVGDEDVLVHLPPCVTLDLPVGSRLSLFPLMPVTGRSEGLHWPTGGIEFAPGGRSGTSNEVSGPVRLEMDRPGMLLILPREALTALLSALSQLHGSWPAL